MQVVGCGPFRRLGVRRWRNTKSGAASPPLGETTPLVGAYSIVRSGPWSRPGLPPVQRLLQPAGYDRESRMFVVVDHLLDVVVVAEVVTDALLVANGGNCAGD